MSGNRPEAASGNDTAYGIVFLLAVFSFMALPIVAGLYLVLQLDVHGWVERLKAFSSSRRRR